MRYLISLAALLILSSAVPAQLMDAGWQAKLDKALPTLSNIIADDALHGRLPGRRLFYTGAEIEHAQQDHGGGVAGFYLSAHNRSANPDGKAGTDFEFPWRFPGGTDDSPVYAWKVMFLPGDSYIRVHYTTLHSFFAGANGNVFNGGGRGSDYRGYGWTFPTGTRFFEVLSFKERLSVFEVRVRTKTAANTWKANVYRPFVTREEFDEVAEGMTVPVLSRAAFRDTHLHRNRSSINIPITSDEIAGFVSQEERDRAIQRTFKSALNRDWLDGVPAPWTKSKAAIVPVNYAGVGVGNTQESCQRCHQDAGTHVRFFDNSRQWYGAVRGEPTERILSFHPISPEALSRNGARQPVILNKRLITSGFIRWEP